ncbi:MAG: hypothetical protein R3E10_14190 [Gemmatimonadota bacterium]
MSRLRYFTLLLAALLPLLAGNVAAQTIRSVSKQTLEIVPGTRDLMFRVDGAGLADVTEVKFLKNGREVRGITSTVRATSGYVTLTIAADDALSPLDGIDIELRGSRLKEPIRVPAKALVASRNQGSPATLPPASDASVQVATIEVDANDVYVGGTVPGRVRLTTLSSQPVEVEVVSERPQSLEAPGVVVVPAGQIQAAFELKGVSEYIYLGDPWTIEVQARKVPYTSGPTRNVRVLNAPSPDLALFPNVGTGDWDFGNNSYAGPPPATPATSGETRSVRIRLAHEPIKGGTLQLGVSGPASVQTSVSITPGTSRMLNVPVNFGTVTSPQQVTVTVTGYGVSRSAGVMVYPDAVVVTDVSPEGGSGSYASVVGGDALRLDVTLSQPAPAGGYVVLVQASDPGAVAVNSLTIPPGSTTGLLIVGIQATSTQKTLTLSVGDVAPQTFTVNVLPNQ